jgi:hypothetical protein
MTKSAVSSASQRMRRYRERLRHLLRIVSIAVNEEVIEHLVVRELLPAARRHDRGAVALSLEKFVAMTVEKNREWGKLGRFSLELGKEDIDQLVRLKYLIPEGRKDPRLVLWAFEELVREALYRKER